VHIDRNNGNELGSEFFGKVDSFDSDNELIDSLEDQLIEILHGTFSTVFELIDGSLGIFGPYDQGDDQSDLSTEKLDPLVSLEFVFTLLWHLPRIK